MAKPVNKAKEITDARISFVSLVDKAANKRPFLIVKNEDGKAAFTTYGRIIKSDDNRHFVTGIVYEPMTEDAHGNYMTADEIAKAAFWFAKTATRSIYSTTLCPKREPPSSKAGLQNPTATSAAKPSKRALG